MRSKTVVLVTNALQYLPHADNILWLDKGVVKGQGTYGTLVEQGEPESPQGQAWPRALIRMTFSMLKYPDMSAIFPQSDFNHQDHQAHAEIIQ